MRVGKSQSRIGGSTTVLSQTGTCGLSAETHKIVVPSYTKRKAEHRVYIRPWYPAPECAEAKLLLVPPHNGKGASHTDTNEMNPLSEAHLDVKLCHDLSNREGAVNIVAVILKRLLNGLTHGLERREVHDSIDSAR